MLIAKHIPHLLLATWTLISGREEGDLRRHIYQANVPDNWKTELCGNDLRNTMQPIGTFWIDGGIKITLHSFPSDSIDQRVPPSWQVSRWKESVDEASLSNCHFNGYCGLFFEGHKGDEMVLGWALQLDPDLYQMEKVAANTPQEIAHATQKTADITIKAVGHSQLIRQHKQAIEGFASSFQTRSPFHK